MKIKTIASMDVKKNKRSPIDLVHGSFEFIFATSCFLRQILIKCSENSQASMMQLM